MSALLRDPRGALASGELLRETLGLPPGLLELALELIHPVGQLLSCGLRLRGPAPGALDRKLRASETARGEQLRVCRQGPTRGVRHRGHGQRDHGCAEL